MEEHGNYSRTTSGWANICAKFRGLFVIILLFQNFYAFIPRLLTVCLTMLCGAMFAEHGSSATEAPLLFGGQIQETESFTGIVDSLPSSRDPENRICDVSKISEVLHPLFTSQGPAAYFQPLTKNTTFYGHTRPQATLQSYIF